MTDLPAMAMSQRHSFPARLARRAGVGAALIAKYLAHRIKRHGKVKDGCPWTYLTLDALAAVYPYLSRTAINSALRRLERHGIITIGNHNRKAYDRTRWYSFTSKATRLGAEKCVYHFLAAEALEHGLMPAIILNNLRHWLGNGPKEVSPARLGRLLGVSDRTIKRALRQLVDDGLLTHQGRRYRLAAKGTNPNNDTNLKSGFAPQPNHPGNRQPKTGPQACVCGLETARTRDAEGRPTARPVGGPGNIVLSTPIYPTLPLTQSLDHLDPSHCQSRSHLPSITALNPPLARLSAPKPSSHQVRTTRHVNQPK